MGRTFLRSYFIIFLCALSLSCSFAVKSTGDIEFALPDVALSRGANSDTKAKFTVSLKTQNNKYLYNKEHDAGSVVFISRVPYGDYNLSLVCKTDYEIIEGSENVSVRTGNGTVVNVQLRKKVINHKPDQEPDTNPEAKPEPDQKPNPDTTEPEIKPEPDVKPNPDPDTTEPEAKPEPDVKPNPDPDTTEPEGKPEPDVKPNPDPDTTEPEAKPEPDVKPNPDPDTTEPEGKPEPDVKPNPDPDATEPEAKPEPDVKPNPEPGTDPEVKPELEPKGAINLSFIKGPSPAISLNIELYKGGELQNSYTDGTSAGKYKISELLVGNNYKIVISGKNSTHTFNFIKDNINVEKDKTTNVAVELIGVPITSPEPEPIPGIKPEPAKGIYCVDGNAGSDEGNDGSKAFKTISAVLKLLNTNQKKIEILYLNGTIKENTSITLPAGINIKTQNNSIARVEGTVKDVNFINYSSSTEAYIENVEFVIPNGNKNIATLKIGDSGKLSFGKNVKFINTGNGNNAINLGSQGTITVINPSVIDSENYIYVQSGGKINVLPEFNGINGIITINKENVGGEENSQIITYNGSAAPSSELSAASKKFTVLNNKYSIDENGKLQAPDNGSGGETGNVTSVWGFGTLESGVKNGGTFKIEENLTFNSKLIIEKPVTIIADKAVTLTRGNSLKDSLFEVAPSGYLIIEGPNAMTAKITVDGGNSSVADVNSPLISCYGNLTLTNCVLQNNDNKYISSTLAENGTGALYIGEGTAGTNEQIVTITDTDFKNNKVKEIKKSDGGVITIEPHKNTTKCIVTITRGSIDGNAANHGAIDVIGTSKTKVEVNISGTDIKNNQSFSNGGGLNASNAAITISNVTMSNNTAKANGGGIAMNNANIAITGSIIKDNSHNATLVNNKITSGTNAGAKGKTLFVTNPGTLSINGTVVQVNRNDWFSQPITNSSIPVKNAE